tara:strand:+ start:359 stop:577 length:219 start_codon:yes stop_codon:yes gene_type:complete
MTKKKNNLKETFQDLDDILKQLESSELDIDKMVELYEKGMNLTKACKIKIKEAEQKIKVINDSDNSDKDCIS